MDLSPYSKGLDLEPSVDTAEVSTFGLSSKTYITGLKDAKVSLEGILDGAATGNDARLFTDLAALATAGLIGTSFPQGDALGNFGYAFKAYDVSMKVSTPVADVSQLTTSFQVTGGVERVVSEHAFAADAGIFTGTSIDNAASSATGGVGYIQADGGGAGATTETWKIQHSVDNVTWVDLVTFSALTDNVRSAERLTAAGTVNRYTRALSSAGTNGAKVQAAFGRT